MQKVILIVIYSIGAFLLAGLVGKLIAPSTVGEELILVWVSALLALIVGLLGVILHEISDLKNKYI